ncbi:hypothetical protein RHRU231_880045 [Rhodococcus ruber]|uniref:Uncharacterized protein n=1 Tax=Rhodococcus ruber TaxID=1830 RepID=A0A098BSY5_9NOCA|nr:hypothetical protein RHRU231_880045 [Rhodococcus ruber]
MAGNPSRRTNRCVFSDALEKYTNEVMDVSHHFARVRRPAAGAVGRLATGSGSDGEGLDPVRAEARPVLVAGDHHGGLQVTEGHHVVPRFGVLRDVDDGVLDTGLVEGPVGGIALNAGRLGVDGDVHGFPFSAT